MEESLSDTCFADFVLLIQRFQFRFQKSRLILIQLMIGENWTIAIWRYYTILILKNRKGIIMRNSNFNLIKSLGYVVVLVSMASHSVPHEYWQNTEDGLLYGHVGDSEEEHKLLMMEGAV